MSVDGASKLLTRAVELDGAKRWTEAIVCYQEGIQMLMDGIKGEVILSGVIANTDRRPWTLQLQKMRLDVRPTARR